MKKILKISGISIAVILILLIITPFLFKSKIVEAVKKEANENVNAVIDFNDVGLSLFKFFPNFSLSIDELKVIGIEDFENDTLFYTDKLYFEIDLLSVFKGDSYDINSISIDNSTVNLIYLENEKANWDIIPETEAVEGETEESSSFFVVNLEKIEIDKADIKYDDRAANMLFSLDDFMLELKGKFYNTTTDIELEAFSEKVNFVYDNINYLKNVNADFNGKLKANMDSMLFVFKENELKLNQLPISFNGKFAMPDEDYLMDIEFESNGNKFKDLLSMVPQIYAKDFESVETEGIMSVNGNINGVYNDLIYPNFKINLNVGDAKFKYPDLPTAVEDIQINTSIESPSGDFDDMIINVSNFHFKINENPMDISLNLQNLISDPEIDLSFKGKMNLNDIKNIYPIEDMEIGGLMNVDLELAAKQSYYEKSYYSKIKTEGSMKLNDFKYTDSYYPDGLLVKSAKLSFNPRNVKLEEFMLKMGKSEMEFTGYLSNYLAYFLQDNETLKGELKLRTDYLNADDLIPKYEEEVQEVASEESEMEIIPVPKNIDFKINTAIGRFEFNNMQMRSVFGEVHIKDEQLHLDKLMMDMLGGNMNLSGYYSTAQVDSPYFNFLMNINKFNINGLHETFDVIKQFAPITQYVEGDMSGLLTYNSYLQSNYSPVMKTIDSKGMIRTSEFAITNSRVFKALSKAINNNSIRDVSSKPVNIKYEISDGSLKVEPFKTEFNGVPIEVSGISYLDNTIDYDMVISIPKSMLNTSNSVISNLSSMAKSNGLDIGTDDYLIINAKVTGKNTDPKVKLDFQKSQADIQKVIEDKIQEDIDKLKTTTEDEAQKLKEEMEEKARKEAEKKKKELEKKKEELRKKAEEEKKKQEQKLKEEAKKKLNDWF